MMSGGKCLVQPVDILAKKYDTWSKLWRDPAAAGQEADVEAWHKDVEGALSIIKRQRAEGQTFPITDMSSK